MTVNNTLPNNVRMNSSCADISVDLINGSALVMFKDSNTIYRYFNVSRRAIANLLLNKNMSVGFWVNANLVDNPRVECYC